MFLGFFSYLKNNKKIFKKSWKKIRLLIIGKDSFIPSTNLFNLKNKICIKRLNILNLFKIVTNFYVNSNIFLIVLCVKNNQKICMAHIKFLKEERIILVSFYNDWLFHIKIFLNVIKSYNDKKYNSENFIIDNTKLKKALNIYIKKKDLKMDCFVLSKIFYKIY